MNDFSVPIRMWHGEQELKLNFPAGWDIVPCLMNGHSTPELTSAQIKHALSNPTGCARLSELARNKHQVAIIFDDISRPTPVSIILPHILKKLHAAGIPDQSIRLVCAIGCRGLH